MRTKKIPPNRRLLMNKEVELSDNFKTKKAILMYRSNTSALVRVEASSPHGHHGEALITWEGTVACLVSGEVPRFFHGSVQVSCVFNRTQRSSSGGVGRFTKCKGKSREYTPQRVSGQNRLGNSFLGLGSRFQGMEWGWIRTLWTGGLLQNFGPTLCN